MRYLTALLLTFATCAPLSAQNRDSLKAEVDSALSQLGRALHGIIDMRGVVVPPPNPDPGDSIPSDDDRMIQGRFPLVGWGADALQACAPEGGGD